MFLTVVTRAYVLHMDINCGCFATPEPVSLKKIFEDVAHGRARHSDDRLRLSGSPQAPSLVGARFRTALLNYPADS